MHPVVADLFGVAALCGRIVLAAVFSFAAVAKLADQSRSRALIAGFGVPARMARTAAWVLPALELGVAGLMLSSRFALAGAIVALVLLLVFTAAVAWNLALGRAPECPCFGQTRAKPVGRGTIGRNVALAVCAGLTLAPIRDGASPSVFGWFAGIAAGQPALGLAILGLSAIVVVESALVLHLLKQHGRLLLRLDQLQHAARPAPMAPQLEAGAAAPVFELPTLSGATMGLDALLRNRPGALLVFVDPACQPCRTVLPALARLERRPGEFAIAAISRGAEDTNRALLEHQVDAVLLQRDNEVAESYGVPGTPAAVFVRADGSVGAPLALGQPAILDLVASVRGDAPHGAVHLSAASAAV